MDGGEDFFIVDSKPIEVCRLARGNAAGWDGPGILPGLPTSDSVPRRTHAILATNSMLSVGRTVQSIPMTCPKRAGMTSII